MASRRELKKDINYLTSEIVSECYMKHLLTEKNDAEISKLISETLTNGDEFIARLNHPDGKSNPKLVKKYFNHLRKDLFEKSSDILDRLNKI